MILEKIATIERRYEELNELMANPATSGDPGRLAELAREQSELEDVVQLYRV